MGRIKQFTLRFDTEIPVEMKAMEYLKTRLEQVGISRNAYLIRLIKEDMERESMPKGSDVDMDAYIEKIVSGVTERLSGKITAVQGMVTDAKAHGFCDTSSADLSIADEEKREVLSDDAMDFLNGFCFLFQSEKTSASIGGECKGLRILV